LCDKIKKLFLVQVEKNPEVSFPSDQPKTISPCHPYHQVSITHVQNFIADLARASKSYVEIMEMVESVYGEKTLRK
jgi:hypothetical protein